MMNLLNFIVWNPDLEAFHLGPITVRWYGLMWIIGLALAYLVVKRLPECEPGPHLAGAGRLYPPAAVHLVRAHRQYRAALPVRPPFRHPHHEAGGCDAGLHPGAVHGYRRVPGPLCLADGYPDAGGHPLRGAPRVLAVVRGVPAGSAAVGGADCGGGRPGHLPAEHLAVRIPAGAAYKRRIILLEQYG